MAADAVSKKPTPSSLYDYYGFKAFKMIDWIREHKELLSIRGIEQKANMPDSTLTKAVNGSQKLPKKWEEPLRKILMVLQKPQRASQKK